MHWTKEPFPDVAKASIVSRGGKPIAAYRHQNQKTGLTVSLLYSIDPSGDSGDEEHHVSVASSDFGRMRMPTSREVRKAVEHIGLRFEDCEITNGQIAKHAWSPVACVSS